MPVWVSLNMNKKTQNKVMCEERNEKWPISQGEKKRRRDRNIYLNCPICVSWLNQSTPWLENKKNLDNILAQSRVLFGPHPFTIFEIQ